MSTTIDDLPTNVLIKICKYINWDCSAGMAAPLSKIASILKTEIEVLHVNIDDIIGQPYYNTSAYVWLQDPQKYLLFCPAIKAFSVQRRIQAHEYNILAQRFSNLTSLGLTWETLETVGSSEAWLSFPKLIQINLGGPNKNYEDNSIKKNNRKSNHNLIGLILILNRAYFPVLTDLNLSIIFEPKNENILVDSMLKFLHKHQKTLKNFWILMANDVDAAEVSEDWKMVPEFENRLKQLTLKLKSLILHFYPYHETKAFLQLIDWISTTQTSIETHLLYYPRFQTFYTDLLEDNYQTLTSIAMSIWIFYRLNCQVFARCSNLLKLMVHARAKKFEEFETENYHGELASSELTNILELPKTLKVIIIINFFIETKHTLQFDQFPDLKLLSLQGVGEKENLGCPLKLFANLSHRGVIVEIYRGFNRRLLQSDEEDGENTAFIKLTMMNYGNVMDKPCGWFLSTDAGFDPDSSPNFETLPEIMSPFKLVSDQEFPDPFIGVYWFSDGPFMDDMVYQGQ